MYKLTHKYKWSKPWSAILIIVISFIIVVLPVGFLVGMIYNKAANLANDPEILKQYIQQITDKLNHLPFKVDTKNFSTNATGFISSNITDVLTGSLNVLGRLLMMYFFLYFLLINSYKLETKIINYLPFRATTMLLFGKELVGQTYSNAIGVPVIAVAQGLVTYGGYMIAGVPEAGLWAILTGFSSIIPLVGTAIIWIPVSIFLLAEGHTWQGIFILLFCAIVVGAIDNLIRMVVSKKVGDVHPVITVLGVLFGLKFFGLPGLVFGPLLISYFLILLKLYRKEHLEQDEVPEKPDDDDTVINPSLVSDILKKLMLALNPSKK